MAIDDKDIEQMISLFNVGFSREDKEGGSIFTIKDFGVRIIFEAEHHKKSRDWWNVVIRKEDDPETKRMEVLWALVKGGYFHYLRLEYPNSFKGMLASHNYDKKIIDKRLEVYKDKPKYNYFIELNKAYRSHSPNMIISVDPGFYDFILE